MISLALLLPARLAGAVQIPDYTPNVVDPGGVLNQADAQRVNQALQQLRDTQHIWGAVYIVPSLEGDSIEHLSNSAFKQWKLGQKGSDNGLLLVLAIQDRRSRFEVGYGLEGSLPDVVARRALDDYLAPGMREGETADAIIDAFGFMGRVVAKDPAALQALKTQGSTDHADGGTDLQRGAIAWLGLLALIWFMPPLRRLRIRRRRAGLLRKHPTLAMDNEEIATNARKSRIPVALLIKLFLTFNPGLFVLILSTHFPIAFVISLCLELVVLVVTLQLAGHRYRSADAFRNFLKKQDKERASLIRQGHVVQTESGGYAYTAAYYGSQSSSLSSSSSSSSSGGGSSGGGGASSSW